MSIIISFIEFISIIKKKCQHRECPCQQQSGKRITKVPQDHAHCWVIGLPVIRWVDKETALTSDSQHEANYVIIDWLTMASHRLKEIVEIWPRFRHSASDSRSPPWMKMFVIHLHGIPERLLANAHYDWMYSEVHLTYVILVMYGEEISCFLGIEMGQNV